MKKILFIGICAACVFFTQCSLENEGRIIIPEEPYDRLSDYNFYVGEMADLEPNDRVVPYDLNSPLFSDYAHKARFVWMPEGTSANYTTEHALDFPKGTALIKNFFYYNDERDPDLGRKIIETRILINRGEEWDAIGYIWNDEQTDAVYEIVGDIQDVSWINGEGEKQEVEYIIPNMNQCKGCHAYDNTQKPIGPKVRNLNKDFAFVAVSGYISSILPPT